MKTQILLFCMCIGIFTCACKKDSNNAIEADFMRIYLNSPNSSSINYKVYDIFQTQDKGIVLFGGINTDNSAAFFIQKLDENGNNQTLLIDSTNANGYLSNMIENNGKYLFMWTNGDTCQRIEVSINEDKISIDRKAINFQSTDASYILRICSDNSSGFYLMKTYYNKDMGYHTIDYLHCSADFSSKYSLGDFQFDPTAFEGYQSSLVPKKIVNYLLLTPFQNSFLSNSPYYSAMALNYSADNEAIFQNTYYWIDGLAITSTNKLAFTVANTKDGQLYFVPPIDGTLSKISIDTINATKKAISGIDISSKVLTILSPDEKNAIVIGTTFSGQLSFNSFDIKGENQKQKLVGQTYKYEISSAIWYDAQTLLIAGTTKVGYKYQRTFVIKIPLSQLL